jgi:hypothetical protein
MGKGKDADKLQDQADKMKIPAPDWVLNRPELRIGLEFYYMAFHELSSCRAVGMGEGPIPWTAMKIYADTYEIYDDEFERFVHLLTDMDMAYLKERNKK